MRVGRSDPIVVRSGKITTTIKFSSDPNLQDAIEIPEAQMNFAARPDPMHRFSKTPHAVRLSLMGRTVSLETNDTAVIELARAFFERHRITAAGHDEFLWRIVTEPDPRVQSTDVPLSAFSSSGIRYVSFGHRGFLAVDLARREAIGFAPSIFFQAEQSRNSRLFDILFCLTAPSLGLTAMSGGCVALENRGVMVFGPPNSGKTTACYLAARSGLEFHADQGVFLDTRGGDLTGWGDLFPAVFRPESLRYLPELSEITRRSSHVGLEFHYLDKGPMQRLPAHSVAPECCVFLDRSARASRPEKMTREQTLSRLENYVLFPEDCMFCEQVTKSLQLLAEKPAYSLQYGSDPEAASAFIVKLLR